MSSSRQDIRNVPPQDSPKSVEYLALVLQVGTAEALHSLGNERVAVR